MHKETTQPQPFSVTTNGREYFLCVKQKNGKNIFFFTTNVDNLSEGQRQYELPNNYEVSTDHGMPKLVKKTTE